MESLDGVPNALAFEIYGGLTMEGFLKALVAPEYGSYHEDRAHANLFARTSNLFASLNVDKAGLMSSDPLALFGRILIMKRSVSRAALSVEIVAPWPIGGAVLTDDGIWATNLEKTEIARARFDKPATTSDSAFDLHLSASTVPDWWQCVLRAMHLTSICTVSWPLGVAFESYSNPSKFETEWTASEGALIAEAGRPNYRPVFPPQPTSFVVQPTNLGFDLIRSGGSRTVISLETTRAKARQQFGVMEVDIEVFDASSSEIFARIRTKPGDPVIGVAAISLDGRVVTTFDLRKFSEKTRDFARIIDGKGVPRAFAPFVWDKGREADRIWQVDEIKTNGDQQPRAAMIAGVLPVETMPPEIEKAFRAKLRGLYSLPPDQLIAQVEMDGLFVIDIRNGRTNPRNIFPFGFEGLRVAVSSDRRVLVYYPGGRRCFVLYPDRLRED